MIEKIKAWFKHSVTILWARVLAAAGVVVALVTTMSADPNTNAAIQGVLGPYGSFWLIGVGLITELARRRTLAKV
jgi:hypothetical protein